MYMENMTIEQEDELLRADIFAAESGTNDQEDEESTDEVEETSETGEADESGEDENQEETHAQNPKKKSNIAKILAEKNEYKRESLEKDKIIEELQSKLGADTETDVKYFEAMMDKKIAERFEAQDFFLRNPEAREFKKELDEFRTENPNLSLDRAYTLFLAETNPQALLDEQTRNKLGANKYQSV